MRFRPRYSLLTLLIVTALVAAGVMYFRVPHRALVSNPPTAEERLHLEQNFIHRGVIDMYDDYELEYEYLNTWRGQRWLSLVSKLQQDYFVSDLAEDIAGKPMYWLLPSLMQPRYRENVERNISLERVAVIVMSGEKEPPRSPDPVTVNTNGTTVQLPKFVFSTIGGPREGVYILTERQRIFEITKTYPFVVLEPLDLSKIADEHVRRRIEEELSKIAQQQKKP
jgi:hypothetical protein